MKSASTTLLPLHRRQIAFDSNVDNVSARNPDGWLSRLGGTVLVVRLKRIWNVCTTSNDGSLSDTFKLTSSDESDARTTASGVSKNAIQEDEDGTLDAIVVGDEHSLHDKSETNRSNRSETGSQSQRTSNINGTNVNRVDFAQDGINYQGGFKSWLGHKAWPAVVEFFEPRLPSNEDEFQHQTWHSTKLWAFCGSLYLVLNWILYLILNLSSTRHNLYAQIVFYGGLTLFTVPTPVMIALDMPIKSPILFQIWFCIATWWCAITEIIQTKQCGFFTGHNNCQGKEFLSTLFYATGLPAIMMFVVSKRLYNAVAQFIFFVLVVALILPSQDKYARNAINFVIFSVFAQCLHYARDKSQRQMFLLAMQLRQAYRAKHKAQIAESKASFTKRRFANYIFHEVRVPLNNAVLAFQLLQSGNAFEKEYASSTEAYALEQSLNMMKTVLNDVLDFEKMDSGHFETIPRPFPLHHSIRAILDQIQVQAESRHLVLVRHLDPRIDKLSKCSLNTDEGLWVVGSELRLRQILTNLASNAIKYTPDGGGSIQIMTEFLGTSNGDDVELPDDPPEVELLEGEDDLTPMEKDEPLASPAGKQKPKKKKKEYLHFRLEVQDSGPGIKPSDLVDDRLFQPFVQTSVGKSFGSGTGLGLAIVKQIIKLSGGRLGVKSQRGEGAKFWLELSYPIASAEEVKAMKEANALTTPRTINQFIIGNVPERRNSNSVSLQSLSLQQHRPKESSEKSVHAPLPPVSPDRTVESPSVEQENSLPAPTSSLTDPLLVLVVDDDKLTRAMSSKLLTKLGCIVDTASDGKECLEMVLGPNSRKYDLICLDNFMPEMTGEEAVRELRIQDRDDFVVGCTGNALTEDQVSYMEAGVDEVLTKPIMLSEYKRVIELAQQRRHQKKSSN